MAKLYGVEIKKLSSFKGKNFDRYKGNIYISGTKVGTWSQDFDEDKPDIYSFNTKKLEQIADRYKTKHHEDSTFDKDYFMIKLLNLALLENYYKLSVKNNYSVLVNITNDERQRVFGVRDLDATLETPMKKFIYNIKVKMGHNARVEIYENLEDFIISK